MPGNEVGRAYSRPKQALACPGKTLSARPNAGRTLRRFPCMKLPVSFGQQPKLRNDHVIGVNYSTISASQSKVNSSLGPLKDVAFQRYEEHHGSDPKVSQDQNAVRND